MGTWLKKREYTLTNEIISLFGQMVLRQILEDINSSNVFSIIADEATDIAHNELMCIVVRWVDSSYDIYETRIRFDSGA